MRVTSQKGSIAVKTAVAAVPLVLGVGLALNAGQGFKVQANLQDSVDATALCAAETY